MADKKTNVERLNEEIDDILNLLVKRVYENPLLSHTQGLLDGENLTRVHRKFSLAYELIKDLKESINEITNEQTQEEENQEISN